MLIGATNRPESDTLQEIRWIGEQGFAYIDLQLEAPAATPDRIDAAAVRSLLSGLNLAIIVRAAADLPVAHAYGRVRRAALDELRRSADLAAELGSKLLVTRFQHWPDWMGDDAGNDHLPLGAVGHGGVDWQREVSNFRAFGYDRMVTLEVSGDRRWLLASRVYLQELWAKD